jgi:hypothetical protein
LAAPTGRAATAEVKERADMVVGSVRRSVATARTVNRVSSKDASNRTRFLPLWHVFVHQTPFAANPVDERRRGRPKPPVREEKRVRAEG